MRGETLALVARDIGVGGELHIGTSETRINGRENDSNLEDAMEALIGAMYLDGGIEAVEMFVLPRWSRIARGTEKPPKDAKTTLQEWAQGRGLPVPAYTLIETSGPAHAPLFTIEVSIEGVPPLCATAANKRTAEQAAAKLLLNSDFINDR